MRQGNMILVAHLGLSYACNMRCKHCFVRHKKEDYVIQHYKEIIDKLNDISSLAVCFFSSNSFIILLIFSIQEFIFGYFRVYSNVAINKNVDNAYRATILSVKSLLNSVFKIIIFMILGKIMDRYYLNTTYVVIALVFLIGGILIGFIAKVNAFIFLFSNRSRE